jgi:hypothetical protein
MSAARKLPRHIRDALKRSGVDLIGACVTNRGHLRLMTRGGVVFASWSPSDRNAVRNVERDLRRVGGA